MNQMRGSRVHVTTWIVGVDGSRDAAIALRWATDMAAQTSGDIVPVCAWYVPLPIFALAGRRSVDVDRAGLEATANVAANASIDMSVRDGASPERIGELTTLEGHPSEVLLDLAGDGRVVVVGRRGIGHFRHRVLGSVSRDLATHARGPVAIVPDEWEHRPCRSVVVGFDGSDYSQAALEWALANAPAGARVRALSAIDVVPWLQPELVIERHPEYVADAERRIRAAADEVDAGGRAERVVVLHGPRQALAEAMADADLMVVGPRGLGAVSRSVLGSVTTWLLQDAACPVAVIPR